MAKKLNEEQIKEIQSKLAQKEKKSRSAWGKAVLQDAQWLLDNALEYLEYSEEKEIEISEATLLNGARSWEQYSDGGMAFVNDMDIAKHYCSPSELKKVTYKEGGVKDMANSRENWLQVQARALRQAWWAIRDEVNQTTEFSMFMAENEKGRIKYHKTKMQGKGSLRKGKSSNFSIDYISENSCDLADFPAWSGAKDRLDEIIELGIEDEAEDYINEMFYGETPTDVQINDLLWFDMDDWIDEHRQHSDNFNVYAIEWDEDTIREAEENEDELPTELDFEDVEVEDKGSVRDILQDLIYDEVGYQPSYFEYESESGNFSIHELSAIHDSRKSFYGKAQVDIDDKNGVKTLYSYGTKVATFNPKNKKVEFFNKDLYSMTTKRHIKEFLSQNGVADTKFSILSEVKQKTEKVVSKGGILMF